MNAFDRLSLAVTLTVADDEIREAFRKRAAEVHPDSGGDESEFAALQGAQDILLSPARRLKEWMAARGLESEARGQIEGGLMDLFQKVAEVGSEAEAEIKRNAGAQSALAKAQVEVKLMTQREKVKALLAEIDGEIRSRTDGFEGIEKGEADPGKIVRDLIFLEKWRATLKGVYGRLM